MSRVFIASVRPMDDASALSQRIAGRELSWTLSDQARMGDHRWWISDLGAFRADYPEWDIAYDLERTLHEIHDANQERWAPA